MHSRSFLSMENQFKILNAVNECADLEIKKKCKTAIKYLGQAFKQIQADEETQEKMLKPILNILIGEKENEEENFVYLNNCLRRK